jgi:uncharacterized protein (DUF488 family)
VRLSTIGFTQTSARAFFTAVMESGARRLVDVRLENRSQLAGFAKRDDLAYFLERIAGLPYEHLPSLAPTRDLLDAYRAKRLDWLGYREAFIALLQQRHVERAIARERLAGACLLCSEHRPERCHRRLVAEYLGSHWGDVEIVHLVPS